ncbi:adenosylcobinamide-GDP ribazoletransferase [Sphingomonas sp. PAMC 26605]|uniref:adenosylcobinamide-GDP ribazoletransferase n=1 Tax=Sphingomonas sp. PAMC 26605 TaxID=1112214 RepID=UPI00026CCB15|nr:adenosylcobinamide-GDP ribazoletransferase [Sphingomonas sp. PAMC 26605]
MKRLIVAFGFLTRLPMPRVVADGTDFAAAIRFYPIVGLAIGGLVAASGRAGSLIDPWLGALAALIAWVAVTGALHLDGLGDLADGLGAAHRDRVRLLAVMADPHIGSFGVVTIVLQLLAKLVLLHALVGLAWWPLILVPFAARIGPLAWARWLPPLRDGLGARVATAVRARDLIGWALVLTAGAAALPAMLAAPMLILGFGLWLRWRIGGVTGDCHGAGIELVETGLLLAIVARGL